MVRLNAHLGHGIKKAPRQGSASGTAPIGAKPVTRGLSPREFVTLVLYSAHLTRQSTEVDLTATAQTNERNLDALIHEMPNLRKLCVRGVQLCRLPRSIGSLKNLQELDVSNNALTQLPNGLCELTKLRYLNVSNNAINELPANIGRLQSLRYLNVSRNNLWALPEQIAWLGNLRVLRMALNKLIDLPEQISGLHELQVLHVSLNQLRSLPGSIGNMDTLKVLNVSCNHLTEVPEEIGDLQTLRRLDLSSNALSHLPPQLAYLHNLRVLDITVNHLNDLPVEFTRMPNLEQLRSELLSNMPTRRRALHKEKRPTAATHTVSHPPPLPQPATVPGRASTMFAAPPMSPLSGSPAPVNSLGGAGLPQCEEDTQLVGIIPNAMGAGDDPSGIASTPAHTPAGPPAS